MAKPQKPAVKVRKPPSSTSVESFVSGQASKRPDVQTSRDRMTIYLPSGVAARLRVHCASHRRELSAVVTEAVVAWLEQK